MKSKTLILGSGLLGVMLTLVAPAAEDSAAKQPRYRLVDQGSLGGPNTYINCCGVEPILNNRGLMVGGAETAEPNPNGNTSPTETILCSSLDPFVDPAVVWQDGVARNLGALPGGFNSFAVSITDNGLIVGTSETGNWDPFLGEPECRATLWWHGHIRDLGTLGGHVGIAFQGNVWGQVIGFATNSVPDSLPSLTGFDLGSQTRAFLWEGGVMSDLGTLGGPDAQALFINDRGDIAGSSYTDSTINEATGLPTLHAFIWKHGRMTDLGTLGGTRGLPTGLNARGEIVGVMSLAGDLIRHPFLWRNGVLKDLGTLGGPEGKAFAINDAGEVVGRADPKDITGSGHHAFLWREGRMIDLGILPGMICSTAFSINNHEQVVGDTASGLLAGGNCQFDGPPFISEHGQPMVLLTSLIAPGSNLDLLDATEINDRGEIACQGLDPDGNLHACLLVPIDRR